MHYRCVTIVFLYSIQVFCQNNDQLAMELTTRITNQETKDVFNLDPSDMFAEKKDSQELDANEWLDKVLSESLNNSNNRINAEKPPPPEYNVMIERTDNLSIVEINDDSDVNNENNVQT